MPNLAQQPRSWSFSPEEQAQFRLMQDELRRYNDAVGAGLPPAPPAWTADLDRFRRFRDWQALNLQEKSRDLERFLLAHDRARPFLHRVTVPLVLQDQGGLHVVASATLLRLGSRLVLLTAYSPRVSERLLIVPGDADGLAIDLAQLDVIEEPDDFVLLALSDSVAELLLTSPAIDAIGLDRLSFEPTERLSATGLILCPFLDRLAVKAGPVITPGTLYFNARIAAGRTSGLDGRRHFLVAVPEHESEDLRGLVGTGVWQQGLGADPPRLAGIVTALKPGEGTLRVTRLWPVIGAMAEHFSEELERDISALPERVVAAVRRRRRPPKP